jgi:hypothetical protein
LSGFDGWALLINLLNIEKKFSNAGYQSNKSIKIGETDFNRYKLLLFSVPRNLVAIYALLRWRELLFR